MLTKNGKLYADSAVSYSALFPSKFVDSNGDEVPFSESVSSSYGGKLYMCGYDVSSSNLGYRKAGATASSGNFYIGCGFRSTPLTEDSFSICESGLTCSYSSSDSYFKSLTFSNGTDSDIDVNEIDIWYSLSSSNRKGILLSAYSFDKITLAPGDTFSVVFKH